MSREEIWKKKRLGMITASEVGDLTSASGKIIDGVVSYIRRKRFERIHGYSLPVSSRAMDIGNDQEPMALAWLKANCLDGEDPNSIVYSKDNEEITFWTAPDCPLGASPDAYTNDERVVFEFKTLVGNETTEFYMDPYTSYEEKKLRAFKEHGDQILAQFIANPKVKLIVLVKYAPQRDDVMEDVDSPLASWRGLRFIFERKAYEFSISELKARIRLIDAMISSHKNPSEFKKGEWYVDGSGILKKKEK